MKIVWSGQHTRGKALGILLKAMRLLPDEGIHVDILGDGREHARYVNLARKLGVSDSITWHGWKPKNEALNIVKTADVFVITSIRDLTSTVLMEALSTGKPVICLDHCGFTDVVDDTCGIKVTVGNSKSVVRDFAKAIERLKDAQLRNEFSAGALKKSQDYTWAKKGSVLEKIYGAGWKKVLVSVYACSPYRGSEPGMGWNFLKLIAERNEVWAIVEEEKWRKDVEGYLMKHSNEMTSVHWVFIRKPRARLLRKIWPPSYYWFYRIWQRRAYKKAQELNNRIHFDVVHQLNMVGFREPGYLWKLPTRFVWGPVGGLGYTDWRLLGLLDIGGKVEFTFRNVINWLHAHFLIRPRRAARKAAACHGLIAATSENQYVMKKLWGVEAEVICEIGW